MVVDNEAHVDCWNTNISRTCPLHCVSCFAPLCISHRRMFPFSCGSATSPVHLREWWWIRRRTSTGGTPISRVCAPSRVHDISHHCASAPVLSFGPLCINHRIMFPSHVHRPSSLLFRTNAHQPPHQPSSLLFLPNVLFHTTVHQPPSHVPLQCTSAPVSCSVPFCINPLLSCSGPMCINARGVTIGTALQSLFRRACGGTFTVDSPSPHSGL